MVLRNGLSLRLRACVCACACLAAAMTVSAVETNVAADATLVLNALPDALAIYATNVIHAMAGSTLRVGVDGQAFPAAGTSGFTVVHGVTFPTDANWPTVGTSEADALALFKYSEIRDVEQTPGRVKLYQTGVKDRQFDLYAANWTVASETTISVFEHFASDVMVILDGTVIFSDVHWNQETTKKNVVLSAGSHTLVIVVATQGQNNCTPKSGNTNRNNDGRYGHANAQNVPGLVYNVTNADLTLAGLTPGISGVGGTKFFENVEGDAPFTVYVPAALARDAAVSMPYVLMPRLLIDGGESGEGTVTLDLTGLTAVGNSFRFHGGLLATNGATLVVKGVDEVKCGGYADSDKHWTFYGAPVVFQDGAGSPVDGTVAFETCATLLTLPTRYTIANGTKVALMGANLFGDGDVTLSNFNAQLQSSDAVAEGRTITVGAGRTLSFKPCAISESDPWQWAGVAGAVTNDIVLGGTGALVKFPNVMDFDLWGDISGQGDLLVEYEATWERLSAATTLHGVSTFTGTVTVNKGDLVFCQGTPGAAENTVRIGTTLENDRKHRGSIRFTTPSATIARVEATATTATKNGVVTTNEDAMVCLATNQTVRIGTWNGTGQVRSDETDTTGARGSVAEIDVVDTNALVRVFVRERFEAGRMCADSTVRVINYCEQVSIGEMERGAQLFIQGPTATTVDDGAQGEVVLRGTTATVPLAITDLRRLTFESAATVVVTGGAVQAVCGAGTLVVSNGTVRLANIAPTVNVKLVDGGRVVYAAQAFEGAYDLGDDIDPALWLDADAPASCFRQLSFANHPNVVYTNDSVVIDQWFDVRPGQRAVYGWNKRCLGRPNDTHQQVYPYLLTNACNGRTTLQFDRYGNYAEGVWSNTFAEGGRSRAGRRMPLNEPVEARYAVMVFGSENGGGTSVLGGWNVQDGNYNYTTPGALPRFTDDYYEEKALYVGAKTTALATDWSQPIFAESRPTWVDGASVDPTTTGFNGKYQILSFQLAADGSAVPVQCLGGCGRDVMDVAGQIYGEVLIFTNVLTDVQRQRIERYLSKKWGIPLVGGAVASELPASIDVVPGTSVEIEDGGAGEIAFPGCASLTVSGHHVATGVHAGEVVLADGILEIPALKLPWTEADVAATRNAQMGWYDPDDETRYLKRTIANDMRPLAIDALFSKFSGTTSGTYDGVAFLSGFLGQDDYATADVNNRADRRPWKALGARGTGPERTWIDYTVYPEGDGSGNCLRPKTTFSQWSTLAQTERVDQSFKTAFIVTDTSTGGGNPICDQHSMAPTKPRAGYDYMAAIWPRGSLAAFTNGVTRLDGVAVDGSARGYTGRPELLTVQTDGNSATFGAIGYYNGTGPNGETKERSHEILGEMIFYNTVVDDETRAGVESYLMRKWLGKVPPSFIDWRDATVTGAGTVVASEPAYLPQFAASFTGTVVLTNAVLNFALDETGVVTNSLSLPAGVVATLPANGAVNVVGSGRVKANTLIDAGAIEMGEILKKVPTGWTFNLTPACEDARLMIEGGKLKLVRASGLLIIVK